jgi:hypothetical protein
MNLFMKAESIHPATFGVRSAHESFATFIVRTAYRREQVKLSNREDSAMRLLIDTSGIQFRVAGAAKPRPDFKDKERQAADREGRPIWTLRLDAIDAGRETKETIWVEVAGDEPKVTFDGFAVVRGLVFAPWVGRDGKIRRAFRAEAVEAAVSGKAVHAA